MDINKEIKKEENILYAETKALEIRKAKLDDKKQTRNEHLVSQFGLLTYLINELSLEIHNVQGEMTTHPEVQATMILNGKKPIEIVDDLYKTVNQISDINFKLKGVMDLATNLIRENLNESFDFNKLQKTESQQKIAAALIKYIAPPTKKE